MSAQISLAKPEHLNALLPLVEAFHQEVGVEQDSEHRHGAIAPLLDGNPLGAVYLFGPTRAPIGYMVMTFTWSVEFGGIKAGIDQIYVRPAIRRRGLASEAINSIGRTLRQASVRAISLEVRPDDAAAMRLYEKSLFHPRERYQAMTRKL